MEPGFWHSRWATGQIGFHQAEVNPYLQRFWPILEIAAGTRVLVPLCGKSVDMTWLAEQGLYVVGVELAEAAGEAYFTERGIQPLIEARGEYKVYRDDRCEIWCGDFFGLTPAPRPQKWAVRERPPSRGGGRPLDVAAATSRAPRRAAPS